MVRMTEGQKRIATAQDTHSAGKMCRGRKAYIHGSGSTGLMKVNGQEMGN